MDYISLLYYFSRLQPSVIHKVLYVKYHKHQGSAVTELTLYHLRILVVVKSVSHLFCNSIVILNTGIHSSQRFSMLLIAQLSS